MVRDPMGVSVVGARWPVPTSAAGFVVRRRTGNGPSTHLAGFNGTLGLVLPLDGF